MKMYDVVGIGSALMDILVEVDEKILLELNLEKGRMHLIDEKHSKKIISELKKFNLKLVPGGSAANTLTGIANLGGRVVFFGKVGSDENGKLYEKIVIQDGMKFSVAPDPSSTGHAITFITPDSERTFATFLGATLKLLKEDIVDEDIAQSKILHIEGYQLEDPKLRNNCIHAMEIAKKNNTLISVDCADANLIKRRFDEFNNILKDYADIIFANEDEAEAVTSKKPEQALEELSKFCKIAIVKLGEKGSIIKSDNKIIKIQPFLTKPVSTNGAGDMYAAGFLYGLSNNLPLEKCGKIGSYLAMKVVEQIGARLPSSLKDEIENL
jgi:sugar/nucleoside kinase (ribokinase family)